MKIKTIVQFHFLRYACRFANAVTKAKSKLKEILKDYRPHYYIESISKSIMNKKFKKQKKLFGSIRTHYNWCSSHVRPMPISEPSTDGFNAGHDYYDSSWNSTFPECEDEVESQLSGYLHWLEEKKPDSSAVSADIEVEEIDRLAAKFIANCHEMFRLEKQESYRRYHEMMARSV